MQTCANLLSIEPGKDVMGIEETDCERTRALRLRKALNANLANCLTKEYRAVVLHSSSTIFDLNREAADLFGYSIDEMIGLNAWTLFPASSADTLMDKLTSKSTDAYQVMAKRKNRDLFNLELKGRDFEYAGEPVRVVLLKEVF